MAASATVPSGRRLTSATTFAGPLAPGGKPGDAPWRSSGMPASRVMSGSFSANVIGTVSRTGTGLPSTLVTSYSHWRAAVSAASSKGGTLRSTSAMSTLPVASITSSRMTMPRWPAACASSGKTGETKCVRLGAGTSRPATFTSGGTAIWGAPGTGVGAETGGAAGSWNATACAAAAVIDAAIKVAVACLIPLSGLALDLAAALRPGGGDDLVLQVARYLVVVGHLHVVGAAGARHRGQLGVVAEHLRQRHLGLDDLHAAALLHALRAPAPAGEVAHHRARVFLGHADLDLHDWLQERGPALRDRVLVGERAGDLERHLRGVDVVVLAVVELHLEVDHRVAGDEALHPRLLNALLDRGDEVLRDGAPEDVVHEREVAAAGEGLHADLAITELAVSARLLLVPPMPLRRALDR